MAFALDRLSVSHPDLEPSARRFAARVRRLLDVDKPKLETLWNYYANPMSITPRDENSLDHRPYRLAQEWGLPTRITGRRGTHTLDDIPRKQVVIENDIAWRIDAMVDHLFGRAINIRSTAADESRRTQIESILRATLSANGGLGFLQRLALLGAVYGHIDVLVKLLPDENDAPDSNARDEGQLGQDSNETEVESKLDTDDIARRIRFEIVEPTRSIPIVSTIDPTTAVAFAQVFFVPKSRESKRRRWWDAVLPEGVEDEDRVEVIELISPAAWQRYEDRTLVAEGMNPLGRLPLVHAQNIALPFDYAGASDAAPLVPLQDELNTRLSDRASRITMQSFKMYLGKGIDKFLERPVGPGQMWATENDSAQIVEIGGDAECPSEDRHIQEIREALDKTSAVSPITAGVMRGRIGNLTSAEALRVTFQMLVARTLRKRTTYGPAIARLCELTLAHLDAAKLFKTDANERGIDIDWPAVLADGVSES